MLQKAGGEIVGLWRKSKIEDQASFAARWCLRNETTGVDREDAQQRIDSRRPPRTANEGSRNS